MAMSFPRDIKINLVRPQVGLSLVTEFPSRSLKGLEAACMGFQHLQGPMP